MVQTRAGSHKCSHGRPLPCRDQLQP